MITENPALAHFEGQIRDTIRKGITSYRPSRVQAPVASKLLSLMLRLTAYA